MRSPPLWRETTCEKHDLVQSGKSSLTSWPDVKLIPQTNKQAHSAVRQERVSLLSVGQSLDETVGMQAEVSSKAATLEVT